MDDAIRDLCAAASAIGTGPVSDAMEGLGLPRAAITGWHFVSRDPTACLVGPAFTIRQAAKARALRHDDNRARHPEAVQRLAAPGDVIIVDAGGRTDVGMFGENLALDAKVRGLAGFIVHGAIRDGEAIRRLGFIVMARGFSPVSSRWDLETVAMNEPIAIDGVLIRPGDVLYGDADGLLVLPRDRAGAIFDRAQEIIRREETRRAEAAAALAAQSRAAGGHGPSG